MRTSGILMHISSLPSPGGIGSMGQEAYEFADFLQASGMTIWQVLPVGPTGYGESPYQSSSVFAGNPLLISCERLREEGRIIRVEAREKHAGLDLCGRDGAFIVDALRLSAIDRQRDTVIAPVGDDGNSHFPKGTDDARHRALLKRAVARQVAYERLAGENAGHKPDRRAAVLRVKRSGACVLQTVKAGSVNDKDGLSGIRILKMRAVFDFADVHSETAEAVDGRQTVGAL